MSSQFIWRDLPAYTVGRFFRLLYDSALLIRNNAIGLFVCGVALPGCAIPIIPTTPLHFAAERGNIKTVREWIANGGDLNARYGDYTLILGYSEGSQVRNKTALIFAAENGHLEIVKLLVDAGADIYIVESDNRGSDRGNAFDVALARGYGDIARFLWERSDKKKFARHLELSFLVAFDRSCYGFPTQGQRDLLEFFLTTFDRKYASEALWRISDRLACVPAIRFILDQGVEPASSALVTAASLGLEDIVVLYLQRGANLNGLGWSSYTYLRSNITALIGAAGKWQVGTMRLLLDNGADPNLQDSKGRTALVAIVSEGTCISIHPACEKQIDGIKLLLGRGARADIKDREARTASDYVAWYPNDPYAETKRALLAAPTR